MSSVQLPGPQVWHPTGPVDPDDPTGGMTYLDMVEIVAEIDPAAAVLAAVGARYWHTHGDPARGPLRRLWADDPILFCCAGTTPTPAHRISREHVGFLFADYMTAAVNRHLEALDSYGTTDMRLVDQAVVDVMTDMDERWIAVLHELRDVDPDEPLDVYYRIPFLALDVPVERIETYERADLTWPQALTFEVFGPPETAGQRAALLAQAHRTDPTTRRGHLTLVR